MVVNRITTMGGRAGGGARGGRDQGFGVGPDGRAYVPGYNGHQKPNWGYVGPSKQHVANPENVVDFQSNRYKNTVVTFNKDATATIHKFKTKRLYSDFVSALTKGGVKDVSVYV